jgi:hypothetical protein
MSGRRPAVHSVLSDLSDFAQNIWTLSPIAFLHLYKSPNLAADKTARSPYRNKVHF